MLCVFRIAGKVSGSKDLAFLVELFDSKFLSILWEETFDRVKNKLHEINQF